MTKTIVQVEIATKQFDLVQGQRTTLDIILRTRNNSQPDSASINSLFKSLKVNSNILIRNMNELVECQLCLTGLRHKKKIRTQLK